MEHISLVTPNFIIWLCPHSPTPECHLIRGKSLCSVTQSSGTCWSWAAWEFEIRTQWQVAVKTLRLYPDIHLTKIFTWRNNYFLLWIVIDGELIARREAITGQWTLSRCHAVTLSIGINLCRSGHIYTESQHLCLFWIKATLNQITTSLTRVSVLSSLTFHSPQGQAGSESTRFKWSLHHDSY